MLSLLLRRSSLRNLHGHGRDFLRRLHMALHRPPCSRPLSAHATKDDCAGLELRPSGGAFIDCTRRLAELGNGHTLWCSLLPPGAEAAGVKGGERLVDAAAAATFGCASTAAEPDWRVMRVNLASDHCNALLSGNLVTDLWRQMHSLTEPLASITGASMPLPTDQSVVLVPAATSGSDAAAAAVGVTPVTAAFLAFEAASAAFAEAVAGVIQPGDLVVVHDYPLMLLPAELRKRASKSCCIVFVSSTPWPTVELFRCMPAREELLRGLLGADAIILPEFSYARHLCDAATLVLGYNTTPRWIEVPDASSADKVRGRSADQWARMEQALLGTAPAGGSFNDSHVPSTPTGSTAPATRDTTRRVRLGLAPLGIEVDDVVPFNPSPVDGGAMTGDAPTNERWEAFLAERTAVATALRLPLAMAGATPELPAATGVEASGDGGATTAPPAQRTTMRLILAVDRLEACKGTLAKLLAYEQLLSHPEYGKQWKERVVFLLLVRDPLAYAPPHSDKPIMAGGMSRRPSYSNLWGTTTGHPRWRSELGTNVESVVESLASPFAAAPTGGAGLAAATAATAETAHRPRATSMDFAPASLAEADAPVLPAAASAPAADASAAGAHEIDGPAKSAAPAPPAASSVGHAIIAESAAMVDVRRDLLRRVHEIVGRINGAHSSIAWTPVRLLRVPLPRPALLALMSLADVGFMQSSREGTTVPGMEFAAAQINKVLSTGTSSSTGRPSQLPVAPGVLLYSSTAGGAAALRGAIVTSAFDTAAMADALHTALVMAPDERSRRHHQLLASLRMHDAASWARRVAQVVTDSVDSKTVATRPVRQLTLAAIVGHPLANASSSMIAESVHAPAGPPGSEPASSLGAKQAIKAVRPPRKLIVLSYNGTLIEHQPLLQLAAPPTRVIEALRRLSAQPDADVWIVSSAPVQMCDRWFAGIPVGVAAEDGLAYSLPNTSASGRVWRSSFMAAPASGHRGGMTSVPADAGAAVPVGNNGLDAIMPRVWAASGEAATSTATLEAAVEEEAAVSHQLRDLLSLDLTWWPGVFKLLQYFSERTPGSIVQIGTATLAWSWAFSDAEFGEEQARDCRLHLETLLFTAPAEVLVSPQDAYLLVRPIGLSKAAFLGRLLTEPALRGLGVGDGRALGRHTSGLLVMGDEGPVNEGMLSLASSLTAGGRPTAAASSDDADVKALLEAASGSLPSPAVTVAVAVGTRSTTAPWYLPRVDDALALLEQLAGPMGDAVVQAGVTGPRLAPGAGVATM